MSRIASTVVLNVMIMLNVILSNVVMLNIIMVIVVMPCRGAILTKAKIWGFDETVRII